MVWNKPGGDDEDRQSKDPWSGRQNAPRDDSDELDESIRQFKQRMNRFFGQDSGKGSSGSSGGGSSEALPPWGFPLFIGLIALMWVFSGFYVVAPAQQAVVLRFGHYVRTESPGLHWIPRLVESKTLVDEQKVLSYFYEAEMLTKDENIVSASVAVQYRIGQARDFLYNVTYPIESLKQATASSLRQVIGNTTLNNILTKGREEVRASVMKQLRALIASYNTGLSITDVALQPAKAPAEVKDAFDDAINAQEDEERFISQAKADALKYEQVAKGKSSRILNAAMAYKTRVVLDAEARTAGYLALLPQYRHAPKVTRERMYFDSLESVLGKTTKLLVAANGGNNMFYLPLDKLLSQKVGASTASASVASTDMKPTKSEPTPKPLMRTASSSSSNYLSGRPNRSHYLREGRQHYSQ